MKIDILTLFPDIIKEYLNESIIKRAIDFNKVDINIVNIRDYTIYSNNQVDDYPYGGGNGMVLMCDPVFKALDSVSDGDELVIMLTPSGKLFNQSYARELSLKKHIILLCGHYEGFDERIKTRVDMLISIGDYVLTGGELPALIVMDSVVRLLDNVITPGSLDSESFNDNLLDYPVYTRPSDYNGLKVPEILLSGDHKKISDYRNSERLRITKENRPDLIKGD